MDSADEDLIDQVIKSSIGKNCISFCKMSLSETIPIIGASQYYIGNDTGWGHLASGLNLNVLIFIYGFSSFWLMVFTVKKFSIICPDGLTLKSTGHNTRAKDRIPVDKVLQEGLRI